MRITFVTYVYPHPKRGFNSGIERVIESLSQELARKGHDVHVITTYSRNNGIRSN
jgi:glycosyltransferase involved in cell wall biosynthesis